MYYPNSQIKTNIYTNGGELVFKVNNENYIGFYWKTSDGKFYTGKNPQDKSIQELILITSLSNPSISNQTSEAFEVESQPNLISNTDLSLRYNKLNNKLLGDKIIPNSFNPFPTQEEYTLGEFTRYFCKKANEYTYTEINKDNFTKLSTKDNSYLWQLYIPFKFQWTISGEEKTVYNLNKNITQYMMNKFKLNMLNKFLKEDYLKFWK